MCKEVNDRIQIIFERLELKFKIYTKLARRNGSPIAKSLSMVNPEQTQVLEDWQTYIYGPDIFVSAIWKKGKKKHSLYLPEGDQWVDAWNKKQIHECGQNIEVNTPLHKRPIFIRKGASVELGDLNKLYRESLKIAKDKPDMKTLEQKANFKQ